MIYVVFATSSNFVASLISSYFQHFIKVPNEQIYQCFRDRNVLRLVKVMVLFVSYSDMWVGIISSSI